LGTRDKLRIAAQVEHYIEQLRCIMSDLIVEERERVNARVEELRRQLFDAVNVDHKKVVDVVTEVINEGVGRVFDRVDAKLGELDWRLAAQLHRLDDNGRPPPSTLQ
jgi:hypothetical protein